MELLAEPVRHAHAETLYQAMRGAAAVDQLSATAAVTLEDAYAIQSRGMRLREAAGERIVGMKLGFTSQAKMAQMGISEMIFGQLTDAMRVEAGGSLRRSRFIHPRAEPEIAFVLGEPIRGEITREQARRAVAAVCPAIEIIDSRYRNFRFSLADVVADNSSSSAFVLGEPGPADLDIGDLKMAISIDSEVQRTGSTAAILGDPWRSVIAAARFAEKYDVALRAGDILFAGAATEAVAIDVRNEVRVEATGFAPVSFTVV
jgi:2-oxo-3-hexenedioate decarboxylase